MSGTEQLELKRLGFVKTYASSALSKGESFYKTARGFVPSFAEAFTVQFEDKLAAFSAPIVTKANDKVADALTFTDSKLDSAVGYVNSTLDYSRDLHSKNMSSFAAAKESAYGFVEGYVNATKAALDPKVYVDRATALGKTLVDAVVEYTDPDKLVALATATYDTLVTKTPVSKIVDIAEPFVNAGQSGYLKAHDFLVSAPAYKKLYDTAVSLATVVPAKLQDTPVYSTVYPYVAPVADPVITNFTKSKVIKQIEEHIKPIKAA